MNCTPQFYENTVPSRCIKEEKYCYTKKQIKYIFSLEKFDIGLCTFVKPDQKRKKSCGTCKSRSSLHCLVTKQDASAAASARVAFESVGDVTKTNKTDLTDRQSQSCLRHLAHLVSLKDSMSKHRELGPLTDFEETRRHQNAFLRFYCLPGVFACNQHLHSRH